MTTRRDFAGMERRRRRAARLFARGETQAFVARQLGVTRTTASRWYQAWRESGAAGLKGAGRAGRRSRLTPEQREQVAQALLAGPGAHGFRTEIWTLPRVAVVIERLTGVRYHPGHVWRVLRGLGWSLQRPTTRAQERDERAIARWRRETWPALKKTPAGAGRPSSSSTKAAFPSVPRSAAPGPRGAARRS
jgi:transposase